MLRIRTPLGGIYLSGANPPPKVIVSVKVISLGGDITHESSDRVEYLYPHEMTEVLAKVRSVREIQKEVARIDGDSARIPMEFKNLSAVWEVWTSSDLLDEENVLWAKSFDPEDERLIRLHDVSVYGCFFSSAKSWTQYQADVLNVRRAPLLIRGGMQIASDFMVQGDLSVIPLTSTIGYQANTHVVIHFREGNPDMGRKVFQPEIKTVAEKIARQAVNIFKRYLYLMREDTGAPSILASSELFGWLVEQEAYRTANPFEFVCDDRAIAYVSVPQCEQDVIAVFHELLGMGVLKGLRFLATSENSRYDSCFKTHYADRTIFPFDRELRPLGVSAAHIAEKESKPLVLEFKYNMDALIADFEKEIKFLKDIECLVCWDMGEAHAENYRVASLLLGDSGASRMIYGATHALYHERERRFDIICLKDLVQFLRDPAPVLAEHAQRFK
jgi:hypothetical protein